MFLHGWNWLIQITSLQSNYACWIFSSMQLFSVYIVHGSEVLWVIKLCLDRRSFYFGREKNVINTAGMCKIKQKRYTNIVLVINSFIMLQYKAIIWGLKKREFCKFSMVLAILNNVLTLWWILNYQLVPCVIGNIPRPYLAKQLVCSMVLKGFLCKFSITVSYHITSLYNQLGIPNYFICCFVFLHCMNISTDTPNSISFFEKSSRTSTYLFKTPFSTRKEQVQFNFLKVSIYQGMYLMHVIIILLNNPMTPGMFE